MRMESLPMAPSCTLDEVSLRAQRERYRRAGRGAEIVERGPRRIVVRLAADTDPANVDRLLEVERECCPFFSLSWTPERRLLGVAVASAEHEPAIEAIVEALGLARR